MGKIGVNAWLHGIKVRGRCRVARVINGVVDNGEIVTFATGFCLLESLTEIIISFLSKCHLTVVHYWLARADRVDVVEVVP